MGKSSKTDEELLYYIAKEMRESPEDCKEILNKIVEAIRKCLNNESVINIRRLGEFHLKRKKPSKRRNFKGELKLQDKYYMIRFKPAPSFKEMINKSAKEETVKPIRPS